MAIDVLTLTPLVFVKDFLTANSTQLRTGAVSFDFFYAWVSGCPRGVKLGHVDLVSLVGPEDFRHVEIFPTWRKSSGFVRLSHRLHFIIVGSWLLSVSLLAMDRVKTELSLAVTENRELV